VRLSFETLNLRLLLQAPTAVLLARTFQVRLTFLGSALLLLHDSLTMPAFLISSLLPL